MLLVTGANGFIGRHLCPWLLKRGFSVEALVRSRHHVRELAREGIRVHVGEFSNQKLLRSVCSRARMIVHLAAATDVSDPQINRAANVTAVQELVRALTGTSIERLLFFSSTCATRTLRDAYAVSKREAEAFLQTSGLPVVTFRPTMIYGRGSKEFDTFVRAVRYLPVVPMVGDGGNLLQPVCLDDVLETVVAALKVPCAVGRVYDIAGPEPIRFTELIAATAEALGKTRRTLALPRSLCRSGASVLGRLLRHPPITADQVLAFCQNTCVDIAPARRDLGFDPRSLRRGLQEILGCT